MFRTRKEERQNISKKFVSGVGIIYELSRLKIINTEGAAVAGLQFNKQDIHTVKMDNRMIESKIEIQ